MKKIGILTFHRSHNNGSMLQALALQNIISEKYNCCAEIIDFSNCAQQNMYAPIPKPQNIKQVIKAIIWLTNYKQMKRQYCAYDNFAQKYFNLSDKRYNTSEELKIVENEYDAFIVGSDQVWNIRCIDADNAYYLDFVSDKPCYSYAVSFGANNPFVLDDNNQTYKKYLNKFRKVSVREKNAQRWIEQVTGKLVPICLDPTMLYDKTEWERIVNVGSSPIISGKYIFYYCFSITEEVQKFLNYVSKQTGLPVYFMEAKEWTLKCCWKNGIKLIKQYGPDIYINVVKYAEVFITTSFHGTAFATIYKKRFWYIKSKESESSQDDRAIFFLTQLNLTSQYRTISELMKTDLYAFPDYTGIDERIKELREKSFDYLKSIIEDI